MGRALEQGRAQAYDEVLATYGPGESEDPFYKDDPWRSSPDGARCRAGDGQRSWVTLGHSGPPLETLVQFDDLWINFS